jgi:hypothetical protein
MPLGAYLSHLLPASTNVVVSNIGKVRLLILSLYGVSLTEDGLAKETDLRHRFRSRDRAKVRTVSCATMQYSAGSVSTTLNSTVRIPPRTRKVSPFLTGRYALQQEIDPVNDQARLKPGQNWSSLKEIGLEVDLEKVSGQTCSCKSNNGISVLLL